MQTVLMMHDDSKDLLNYFKNEFKNKNLSYVDDDMYSKLTDE